MPPLRCRYSSRATPTLAMSAELATTPIVAASGGVPVPSAHAARFGTKTPKAAMQAALKMAALDRTCSADTARC